MVHEVSPYVLTLALFGVCRECTFPMTGTSGNSAFRRVLWREDQEVGPLRCDRNLCTAGFPPHATLPVHAYVQRERIYKLDVPPLSKPATVYAVDHRCLELLIQDGREPVVCRAGEPYWVAFALNPHDSRILVGPIDVVKQRVTELLRQSVEIHRPYLDELAAIKLPVLKQLAQPD